MKDKLGVIVVAAGKGTRMGTQDSKQFLTLGGKPILVHTLERLGRVDIVERIVVVTAAEHIARCESYIGRYGLKKIAQIVPGGRERQDSVRAGIEALGDAVEWVMVHDGVRPFPAEAHVRRCYETARETEAAVLAVPVKDTIKVVDADGVIQSTPDRRSLWAIQTPQAFRLSLLREAHEQATRDGFAGTDDAMLVERLGVKVRVVEADYYNIKITTPEDLPWAEWIYRHVR